MPKMAKKPDASVAAMIAKGLLFVFVGCVVNNWVLELIVSKKANPYADPGAGSLLTLLQFMFIAAVSLPAALHFGKSTTGRTRVAFKPTVIPVREYVKMTAVFFAMSFLNNAAFSFHISQPLHMVFRSANLVTTFVMGKWLFGRKYTLKQLACIVLLTAGAASATFAEALAGDTAKAAAAAAGGGGQQQPCTNCPTGVAPSTAAAAASAALASSSSSPPATGEGLGYMAWWFVGIGILVSVLVLQSVLSNMQSIASSKYGKAPEESLFYTHTLSVPMFLLAAPTLLEHARLWTASAPTGDVVQAYLEAGGYMAAADGSGGAPGLVGGAYAWALSLATAPLAGVPVMWTYVVLNVVSQYVCIVGVYNLNPVADPLTVTMTLTVRKFVSLLLSIWWFDNTFTMPHWVGACMVFGGAVWYITLPSDTGGSGAAAKRALSPPQQHRETPPSAEKEHSAVDYLPQPVTRVAAEGGMELRRR